MQPTPESTNPHILDALFPFHVRITSENFRIIHVGQAVKSMLGYNPSGRNFSDVFTIKRPAIKVLRADTILSRRRAPFLLQCRDHSAKLRGQFMQLSSSELVFCGSIQIESSRTLIDSGLTLADLAVHDLTPDLIILHQTQELRLQDLDQSQQELEIAENDRDRYNAEASLDPLTNLYNRRAFQKRSTALLSAKNQTDNALLLIDLDHFKQINDDHGHEVGDLVLREVADRLVDNIRDCDFVGRLGGDEFAVFLHNISMSSAHEVLSRLQSALSDIVHLDDMVIPISASIGAAQAKPQQSLDSLLSDADVAMYAGRKRHRGNVVWYAPDMRRRREELKNLSRDLESALSRGDFDAYFQPIVRLRDRVPIAVEALARWHHPQRGWVPPDKFIDVAQRNGLVAELDKQILARALQAAAEWPKQDLNIDLHVNVSGRSLSTQFVEHVRHLLDNHKVPGNRLTVELTETWLMEDERHAAELSASLLSHGIKLNLDDFGTGYSSLTHLESFPISGLKIDRSFVSRITSSARARRIVDATFAIARSMNLDVVAEGVETEEQARMLLDFGCTAGQGFLFSKPMSADELKTLIETTEPNQTRDVVSAPQSNLFAFRRS